MKKRVYLLILVLIILSCSIRAEPIYKKKVQLIIYNPILEDYGNQTIVQYKGYNDPDILTADFITEISNISWGRVEYEIVERIVVDGIALKEDGFQYNDTSILDCYENSTCHNPDIANYSIIVENYQSCEKRNQGLIDEVWLWGGGYFGYYESRLAGPGAFWYNSPALTGTTCDYLLPIMGFNYEREVAEMLHSYGHRFEYSLKESFGYWNESPTHDFNNYTLYQKTIDDKNVNANAGCGNVHFPANGQSDYDYSNSIIVNSTCDDWLNYPNMTGALTEISCSSWGCTHLGYMKYWLRHIPHIDGSKDGMLMDWWNYTVGYGGNDTLLALCEVVNTSRVISWNMSSNSSCLVINGNNILLEGNGLTLNGNFNGTGINITGSNITISNIIIRNFLNAIQIHNSSNITIINSTLLVRDDGISIHNSTNVVLSDNKLNTSLGNAIFIQGSSSSQYNHTLNNNLAEGLTILFNFSLSNIIIQNRDMGNYGQIICAVCNNVTYNNLSIVSDGLNLFGGDNLTISNSTITTSNGIGVYVTSKNVQINNNNFSISDDAIGIRYSGSYAVSSSNTIDAQNNSYAIHQFSGINTATNEVISSDYNSILIDNGQLTLINSSINQSKVSFANNSSGFLLVKWFLSIDVNDIYGSPLVADITVYNSNSDIESSANDDNVTFLLTELINTGSIQYSTPHTIQTVLSGYDTDTTTVNLSQTNSTNLTITLSESAVLDGGGGGGGIPTAEVESVKSARVWINVKKDDELQFKIYKTSIPVSEISFKSGEDVYYLEIAVSSYKEKPEKIAEKQNTYLFLEIETDFESAKEIVMFFDINKSWVQDNSFDKEKVYLFRLVGAVWNKMPTIYMNETQTKYEYKATLPGFSYFAIAAERPEPVQNEVNNITLHAEEITPVVSDVTGEVNSPDYSYVPIVLLAAFIIVVVLVVFKRMKPHSQLGDYVDEMREKGYRDEDIREAIYKTKWPKEMIDKAMNKK